jgi:HK97 family phage major capsid protein
MQNNNIPTPAVRAIMAQIDAAEKMPAGPDRVATLNDLYDAFDHLQNGGEYPQGRRAAPNPMNSRHSQPGAYGSGARVGRGPQGDFQDLGEFAQVVRASAAKGATIDPRLIANAPTTYSQEGVGADGGFLVPPEFAAEIWQKVAGVEHLLDRCAQVRTGSNTFVMPADEGAPWSTTGPQVAWLGEAGQLTQSKVALQDRTIRLNKLGALVPVSEELMEDAPSLDSYLRRVVPGRMHMAVNEAIVNGTGAGQPLGLMNGASLVSVEQGSGQAADTVIFSNITAMYSRLYAGCMGNAIWLINQDILPQLMAMEFPTAGTGTHPVWLPPGALADAPHGLLLGRPVVPSECCATLGDKGDIILTDLSQYLTILKASGIRSDVSMHLWFDYDVLAYRFIFRVSGMPLWASAATPKNGSNSLSWAVTLDERAG